MIELREAQKGRDTPLTVDEIMSHVLGESRGFKPRRGRRLLNSASASASCSDHFRSLQCVQGVGQVPVTTLLNPTQFMDVVRDPLKYVVALEDDVAREDGVAPGDDSCYLDSGRGGEKKKKKKGTGMESNTSKLASNFNDESVVPIEKPIDIPNFTIEEVVVGSNVTSQHSETTTHGKNTVTPKPTKATGLSSTSTSGKINYTTGQMCSSSLYLNGYCHNKVGDEMKKTVGTYYDCVPSIYATKLSLTSSIMATLRKLDANLLNNTDYDILLPKASVHEFSSTEGIDSMLRDGSWMIREFHDVPLVAYTLDELSLIGSKIGNPMMPNSYMKLMRVMTLVIIWLWLFLNSEGPGYTKETIRAEYEWEHPRCTWMVEDLVTLEVESGNKASTSGLLEEKCVLVDEDGKPLEKVDYSGDHGSEDEVDHVDNEMASFLAKTSGVALWYKSCFRSNGGKKFYGGC
ncbi:hypothetical protein Tco_1286008 [Tanacetum coccineum]